MDYEKKYNEALNQAKFYHGNCPSEPERKKLEGVFPELKESEDERIRKEIIGYLTHRADVTAFVDEAKDCERWIAYFEKQKDVSKAIEAVERIDKYIDAHTANAHDMDDSNPDKKYYRGWDDALGKMAGILQDVYSEEKQKDYRKLYEDIGKSEWYKKAYEGKSLGGDDEQKEQNPAECTPDSALQKIKRAITDCKKLSEHYKDTEENFYQYYGGKAEGLQLALTYFGNENEQSLEEYTPDSVKFDEGFKTGREVGFREGAESVKPTEWSEDDKTRLKVIKEELERFIMFKNYGTPLSTDDIEWLKNLPERFNLQPNREWNGDDNVLLNNIINVIQNKKCVNDDVARKTYVDFLKSLRPQYHWKPSEDQMNALDSAINYLTNHTCTSGNSLLISLSTDLQKLL